MKENLFRHLCDVPSDFQTSRQVIKIKPRYHRDYQSDLKWMIILMKKAHLC